MTNILTELIKNIPVLSKEQMAVKTAAKKEYDRLRYVQDKDNKRIYRQEYVDKARFDMITAYGGKCIKCGEEDHRALVLDHINDDGWQDRILEHGSNNRNGGGYASYVKLRQRGWPKDRHQLLCCNCNAVKEHERRMKERCERNQTKEN